MKYLGIDLGGTNVAAAVVDSEGTILGKVSLPTPRGAEAVADQMAAAARGAAAGTALDEVASVGIGAPGAIEPDTGVIKYWSNLDFTNVPITALMKARLDKEILLENDANAAALGEYAAGAGKGSQSMVAVTLGTGVGGGAILNGKLYTGFNYAGMEIGHFVIEHGGRLCTCGRRGCFEAYCSATALIKRTRQAMEEDRTSRLWELAGSLEGVNGRTPFDAAAQGDPAAGKVIDEYVDYLGCGVARYGRPWATTRASLARRCCRCSGRAPGLNSAPAPQRQRRTSLTAGPPFFRTRCRGPLPGPLALPRPPPAGKGAGRARTEWPP